MLTKKVGNIIIIMIVGLPFRLLEKEDKSSSVYVLYIQAFVGSSRKELPLQAWMEDCELCVYCSSLSLFKVGPGFKETPVSPLCINL